MCFDFLYNFCLKKIFILRRTDRDTVINVHTSSCKVTVLLVRFQWNLNFIDGYLKKKLKISNFMKIHPVGAELFHADGRTDMTGLIVAFRNLANAPKGCWIRNKFNKAYEGSTTAPSWRLRPLMTIADGWNRLWELSPWGMKLSHSFHATSDLFTSCHDHPPPHIPLKSSHNPFSLPGFLPLLLSTKVVLCTIRTQPLTPKPVPISPPPPCSKPFSQLGTGITGGRGYHNHCHNAVQRCLSFGRYCSLDL